MSMNDGGQFVFKYFRILTESIRLFALTYRRNEKLFQKKVSNDRAT